MIKQGKIWGSTTPLIQNGSVEVHRIEFKKGKQCSKHAHQSKVNAFYCLNGILRIDVWKNSYDLVDSTILYEGDFTTVPAGEYHRFVAETDGEALEIYWAELDHNDIVREDVGGDTVEEHQVSAETWVDEWGPNIEEHFTNKEWADNNGVSFEKWPTEVSIPAGEPPKGKIPW